MALLSSGVLGLGRRRRQRLRDEPFDARRHDLLMDIYPAYASARDDVRRRLHPLVNVFLGTKRFEGAAELEITEEIRLSIAAQACWILIGLNPENPYPRLRTIIVYPWAYVATSKSVGPGGVVTEHTSTRAGESWSHTPGGGAGGGPVVLAWDQVIRGARRPADGHNVVYHEFAHRLDALATGMDGAPTLDSPEAYKRWAEVLAQEYAALRRDMAAGRQGELRAYGATNPAEFFAVATEAYFEQPQMMRTQMPDLYEQLYRYYKWVPDE